MTNIPTHIVYHVRDIGALGESETPRAVWTKVGVAWQHNDTNTHGGGVRIIFAKPVFVNRVIFWLVI